MSFEATISPPTAKRVAKKKVEAGSLIKYRLMIFSRFTVALLGGYYLSAISAILLGATFTSEPSKANAVLGATMLSFVIYCAVFIWVFMVNSNVKAWAGIILPSVLMTLLFWFMKG